MSEIVPDDRIEEIVGVKRHETDHYGQAVSAEKTVYVLHSQQCKDSTADLRECPYSIALDRGIEDPLPWTRWRHVQDQPVRLMISRGYLVPDSTNGGAGPITDSDVESVYPGDAWDGRGPGEGDAA